LANEPIDHKHIITRPNSVSISDMRRQKKYPRRNEVVAMQARQSNWIDGNILLGWMRFPVLFFCRDKVGFANRSVDSEHHLFAGVVNDVPVRDSIDLIKVTIHF